MIIGIESNKTLTSRPTIIFCCRYGHQDTTRLNHCIVNFITLYMCVCFLINLTESESCLFPPSRTWNCSAIRNRSPHLSLSLSLLSGRHSWLNLFRLYLYIQNIKIIHCKTFVKYIMGIIPYSSSNHNSSIRNWQVIVVALNDKFAVPSIFPRSIFCNYNLEPRQEWEYTRRRCWWNKTRRARGQPQRRSAATPPRSTSAGTAQTEFDKLPVSLTSERLS